MCDVNYTSLLIAEFLHLFIIIASRVVRVILLIRVILFPRVTSPKSEINILFEENTHVRTHTRVRVRWLACRGADTSIGELGEKFNYISSCLRGGQLSIQLKNTLSLVTTSAPARTTSFPFIIPLESRNLAVVNDSTLCSPARERTILSGTCQRRFANLFARTHTRRYADRYAKVTRARERVSIEY